MKNNASDTPKKLAEEAQEFDKARDFYVRYCNDNGDRAFNSIAFAASYASTIRQEERKRCAQVLTKTVTGECCDGQCLFSTEKGVEEFLTAAIEREEEQ